MRSFQAVNKVLSSLALFVLLFAPLVMAQEHSLYQEALKASGAGVNFVSYSVIRQESPSEHHLVNLYHQPETDSSRLTAYGYDFYHSAAREHDKRRLRVRSGVSKLSTKATVGVQMILSW